MLIILISVSCQNFNDPNAGAEKVCSGENDQTGT